MNMRQRTTAIGTGMLALAYGSAPTEAFTCDKDFTPTVEMYCFDGSLTETTCTDHSECSGGTCTARWNEADNWDPAGVPGTGDNVCISNADVTALIKSTQKAKAIKITIDGELFIIYGTTFELHGASATSTISNRLWSEYSTIKIQNDHTITGSGTIEGVLQASGQGRPAIVSGGGVGVDLTLSGGLELRGDWDVEVTLVNNAAVIADADDLVLKTYTKSGSGCWSAENSGTLIVDIGVSGSGTWLLSNNSNAKIEINAACTSLTGDVQVQKGVLDINQNFDTTGDLTFQFVGGTAPRIVVQAGYTASFD